ncbi:MAG: methyltransferase domain-containing protein [Hyphomicrobiales bacterium]
MSTLKNKNRAPQRRCRACKHELDFIFADLGEHPVANDLIENKSKLGLEPRYPLRVACCRSCRLVQIADDLPADRLFRQDYVYQSSISSSFVEHARQHVEELIRDHGLSAQHHVVEIASNDGYLLQFFIKAGIRVTGIEPAASVAEIACERHGIPTLESFFNAEEAQRLVREIDHADIILANNILAHVPDLFDFLKGVKTLLKKDGVAIFEFPHLLKLLEAVQFDTIYHEHYSYLSLLALEPLFARVELQVVDVKEISVHGGSLRLSVRHAGTDVMVHERVQTLREKETAARLHEDMPYLALATKIETIIEELKSILEGEQARGALIAAYGAPAKGNTLLNAAKINTDLISFTVDKAPSKCGRFLPGSGLPILDPSLISVLKPDIIVILPWNIKDEIINELSFVAEWGGRFLIPIPQPYFITPHISEQRQAS